VSEVESTDRIRYDARVRQADAMRGQPSQEGNRPDSGEGGRAEEMREVRSTQVFCISTRRIDGRRDRRVTLTSHRIWC
jgi:hypothetical protein